MTYRLIGGASEDIDRILFDSARAWGFEAAKRYDLLMDAAFTHIGTYPLTPGSEQVPGLPGLRYFPLRLARRSVEPPQHRVGDPRHIVVYRIAPDSVTEIIGLAHDRMLLVRAARLMSRRLPPVE